MDFAPLIEQDLRAFLNDVFRRVREWLDPFETALDAFVAELFSARLPADWRERWRHKERCSHDGRVAARATRGEKQSTIHAVQSSQWARRSKCVLERG